jgi:hypothetical protein
MTTEVDAEIKRMNDEGKTSQEISEELAKRNIFVTWQRQEGYHSCHKGDGKRYQKYKSSWEKNYTFSKGKVINCRALCNASGSGYSSRLG